MSIYERGLQNLDNASVEELKDWIFNRASGVLVSTPLDSGYTASTLDTSALIEGLFNATSPDNQKKIKDALNHLLIQSTALKHLQVLKEVFWTIGRINSEYPYQVVIDFVANTTDTELVDIKSEAIALLQGDVSKISEIKSFFKAWFFADPVTVGNEHALQLFAGLVSAEPKNYAIYLKRFHEIHNSMGGKEFREEFVWAVVVDNCTEEQIQAGLHLLPNELQMQFADLRKEYPDLYSSYTDYNEDEYDEE